MNKYIALLLLVAASIALFSLLESGNLVEAHHHHHRHHDCRRNAPEGSECWFEDWEERDRYARERGRYSDEYDHRHEFEGPSGYGRCYCVRMY